MNEDYVSPELNNLLSAIKELTDIEDDKLTDEAMVVITNALEQNLNEQAMTQVINQTINNFEEQGLTRAEARAASDTLTATLKEIVYSDKQFTGNKKILIDSVMNKLFNIFNTAVNKYHNYTIELPMTVDETNGAYIPTYAHDTDAASDLYAMEDQVIAAHTYGNKIRTGVKIQLPEGWLAMILPRSSIGAKTPLRLSNSIGLIDSGYRGELGVLYDNISDNDYTITAGDRIAQLLVMPSYRFQAKVVDILASSDRGETGFGDSGK